MPDRSLIATPTTTAKDKHGGREGSGRQLRFLFVVHTPWVDTLGLPRVSIEISRELTALGHTCEKFSLEDAFPTGLDKVRGIFRDMLFQRAVLRHIQREGHRYDAIQAEHILLPYPRESYRFNGHLIAKSNGLEHFYRRFIDERRTKLEYQVGQRGSLVGNVLRRVNRYIADTVTAANKSFATADSIHLLNKDELHFVQHTLGHGEKCKLVSNALADEHASALQATAMHRQKNAEPTIACVGTWDVRKGKAEFPSIIRKVRQQWPSAKFHLIGTLASHEDVAKHLAEEDRSFVSVTSRFTPSELPQLLSQATCGVFPSYIEGLPLGLLEMLTAGLRVVAWDVPGSRDFVDEFDSCRLVTAGDIDKTVRVLGDFLSSEASTTPNKSGVPNSWPHCWSSIAQTILHEVESCGHARSN